MKVGESMRVPQFLWEGRVKLVIAIKPQQKFFQSGARNLKPRN